MKARSNLWRQASEACSSLPVGTEMILQSLITVTSAPRTCAPYGASESFCFSSAAVTAWP